MATKGDDESSTATREDYSCSTISSQKMDIPKDLNLFLTVTLHDNLLDKAVIAIAFLFNEVDTTEFHNLVKSLKNQLLLNCKLLGEFLELCGEDGLSENLDRIVSKDEEYKEHTKDSYESTKSKLSRPRDKCTSLPQRYLELRIILVKVLLYPDSEYEQKELDTLHEHFELEKKPRKDCKTLLNFFLKSEMKGYTEKDAWVTFNLLVENLKQINRVEAIRILEDFHIKNCVT